MPLRRLIAISLHATERVEERFPDIARNRDAIRAVIAQEVDAALEEGRYSVRLPKWAAKPGSNGNGKRHQDRSLRFAWTEDRSRVYVFDKANGGVVNVVTVIRPRDTLPM